MEKPCALSLLTAVLCLFLAPGISGLPSCGQEETAYVYTECDSDNQRWSVQVPKDPKQCAVTNPSPPVRGKSCGFACDAGQYLDLSKQLCFECPVGKFSLGSGIRFDVWDTLPDGFLAESEAVTFTQYGYHSKVNNCSSSKWTPAGHAVISNEDDCTSSLSYSVELKRPGEITFTYQYPDDNIIFHFYVENSRCQTSRNPFRNVFLNTTGTEWKKWRVSLDKGSNVLYWKTTGIMVGTKNKLSPVRIQDIEITGVSYSTECHKCRPGFYAPEPASHWCKLCPPNTHSASGASACEPCDEETEFAPMASESCSKKPPCKEKDYFATHSACDENKMTSVTYEWIDPKLCLDTLEDSVQLPPSGERRQCSPCNPGFYPTQADCLPCPENTYSDGTHNCTQCPASTAPHYGLFYLWWDQLPNNMKTSCISLSRRDCDQKKGWEAVGDEVRTIGSDSGEAYLILVMSLDGYMEELVEGVYGRIVFAFQTDCDDNDCQFYFMKDLHNKGTSVIESWRGQQKRQSFSYDVTANDTTMSFTWAFQKKHTNDMARVFLVNVTNVLGSSADFCTSCAAASATDSRCIPCPSGNYLDETTHECVPCSGNSRLTADKSSCVDCGAGTLATDDHTECNSDCHYISPTTNRHYDFTKLSSAKSAITVPSFTSTGRKYNHVFNFSLCENMGKGNAECIDNVTFAHQGLYNLDTIERTVGMACRSTAVPIFGSQREHLTVHSQPTLIASTLDSITQDVITNDTTNESFFPKDESSDPNDVVYIMSSENVGFSDCANGRKTFLHLRCSPGITDESGMIEMRSDCPDGTCDGCDFYFLWRSIQACPICTEDDYEKVVGACEHGKVTTKYLWKSYPRKCRDGVALPEESRDACQDYSFYIRLSIAGGVALLVLMCVLVCCLWKKSKKLEYKYHRLVMNGKGEMNGGELPSADTCAITDSESDYEDQTDEVIFQKKKAKQLFGKTKVNDYESVVLQPMSTGV